MADPTPAGTPQARVGVDATGAHSSSIEAACNLLRSDILDPRFDSVPLACGDRARAIAVHGIPGEGGSEDAEAGAGSTREWPSNATANVDNGSGERSSIAAPTSPVPFVMHEASPLSIPLTLPLPVSSSIATCTQYWSNCSSAPDISSILKGDDTFAVLDSRTITAAGVFQDLANAVSRVFDLSSNAVLTKFFVRFMERRAQFEQTSNGFDLRYTYLAREGRTGLLFLVRMTKASPPSLIHRAWNAVRGSVASEWQLQFVVVGGGEDGKPDRRLVQKAMATPLKDTAATQGIRSRYPLHRGSLRTFTVAEVAASKLQSKSAVREFMLTWEAYFPWRDSEPHVIRLTAPLQHGVPVAEQLFKFFGNEVACHNLAEFDIHVQHGQFLQVDMKRYEFLANCILFQERSLKRIVELVDDLLRMLDASRHRYSPAAKTTKCAAEMMQTVKDLRRALLAGSIEKAFSISVAIDIHQLASCFWGTPADCRRMPGLFRSIVYSLYSKLSGGTINSALKQFEEAFRDLQLIASVHALTLTEEASSSFDSSSPKVDKDKGSIARSSSYTKQATESASPSPSPTAH